jgi:hypothetical protein
MAPVCGQLKAAKHLWSFTFFVTLAINKDIIANGVDRARRAASW